MNKRSAPGVKMTPSVNNLIFLFLLAFSIFIIYRYVKSLEKELTLLKAELSKVKATAPTPYPKEEQVCVGDVCMMVTPPTVQKEDTPTEDEDDMESVTSKDILKIVDQINDGDGDEKDEEQFEEPSTTPPVPPSILVVEQAIEPQSPNQDESTTEDIIIKKSNSIEDDLYKKTNEELKKILKDQGKNTKGAKAELIKRIIEEL